MLTSKQITCVASKNMQKVCIKLHVQKRLCGPMGQPARPVLGLHGLRVMRVGLMWVSELKMSVHPALFIVGLRVSPLRPRMDHRFDRGATTPPTNFSFYFLYIIFLFILIPTIFLFYFLYI